MVYATMSGFTAFLVAEIILGIGQSFISGADSAMLFDTLSHYGKSESYIKYEGRNYTVGNYAEALAGAIGGAIATVSLQLPFVLQALIAFMAVPAALTLFEPPHVGTRRRPGFLDILGVVKYATVTNRALRYNLLISSIIGTATLMMAWVYQLFLRDVGFKPYAIGMVHAALNLLVGTTTLFAHRVESALAPRRTIWLVSVTITSMFLLLGFLNSAWALAALALFYISRGIATPVLKYYVNRITPHEVRATVLSLRSLVIRLLFAILAPLYGWMSDTTDRATAIKALGLSFTLLIGLSLWLFFRSMGGEDGVGQDVAEE